MRQAKILPPPTRIQLFSLRLMILLGLVSMAFFIYTILGPAIVEDRILYGLLISTFLFTCFKVLYEWYHYLFISVCPTPANGKLFTVDIFTTFCAGEPHEMTIATLQAMQAIYYPHTSYLCDEADDPCLKEVCRNLGVHHITRKDKRDAKAGNINNALKYSTGDLCLILDPDHLPFPEFLDPVVPHFNDPGTGFVQVVQAYSNAHESWVAKGAAQQTYQFYGPMMMTMNTYGTVPAIGANCTFRRSALESIGGHAAGLAEDMHTAMRLHAKGWKSVYVPALLSRGLVPSTLSAYYQQQLKWSRGVFELLVTTYFSLFSRFNLRQKIHYGLLPGFYLSGFIFLINFLIPVISLFTDVYPIKMGFLSFMLTALPFIFTTILIRNEVQRWVMDDNERGFHIVGGLLLIGTWWVHILGIFYTLIRKRVPYLPTPKNKFQEQNYIVLLPNIFILLISAGAVFYGLYNDWNPYTFTMAGLAGINCLLMLFVLLAGIQVNAQGKTSGLHAPSLFKELISALKSDFWTLRRKIYTGVRSGALLISVFTLGICLFVHFNPPVYQGQRNHYAKKEVFYSGIFSPVYTGGMTSMQEVTRQQSVLKTHFNIISFYIPWGNQSRCFLPVKSLDSVYKNRSIPMITWEPWQSLFSRGKKLPEKHIFKHILSGRYDPYILRFALEIKAVRQPVFLRFAHETDNPFYPWSATGENSPEQFKAAWKYLYALFSKNHVYNVIWVWNPWKPEAAEAYFPGKQYVDWIGITGLNYGEYGTDKKNYSLADLYRPFHRLPLFRSGIPVMVAETGSLGSEEKQHEWLNQGTKMIRIEFPEIKATVLFNSGIDKNRPDGSKGILDWRILHRSSLFFTHPESEKEAPLRPLLLKGAVNAPVQVLSSLDNTRGVNYNKAQNWLGNAFPLTKVSIRTDFSEMKKAGINTVKIVGPTIYDRITFEVAAQFKLKIIYSFWIPDHLDFIKDKAALTVLSRDILQAVEKNKDNSQIVSWSVSNTSFQNLDSSFYKPELLYQQNAWLAWVNNLVRQVKKTDPQRTVLADVLATGPYPAMIDLMHEQVPGIDAFGIKAADSVPLDMLRSVKEAWFFSSVKAETYLKYATLKKGAIIADWQDQETSSALLFDGLKDIWGRNKPQLFSLSRYWNGQIEKNDLPPVKILRPAIATDPGFFLPYRALLYQGNSWQLASPLSQAYTFEWYLIKTDQYGADLSMTPVGSGAVLNLKIPAQPSLYRLYLICRKGNNTAEYRSILNIPL